MRTLSVFLPESIHPDVRVYARRAARVDDARFAKVLAVAPDLEPQAGDEWPPRAQAGL